MNMALILAQRLSSMILLTNPNTTAAGTKNGARTAKDDPQDNPLSQYDLIRQELFDRTRNGASHTAILPGAMLDFPLLNFFKR